MSAPIYNFGSGAVKHRPARTGGTYFKTGGALKRGQFGEGCYLSHQTPNCIGDEYLDASTRRRKSRASSVRNSERPFEPSGPFQPKEGPFLSVIDADASKEEVAELKEVLKEGRKAYVLFCFLL